MLIIVLSLLTAIGIAALIHAVSRADVGYENETGFHYGTEPLKVVLATPAAPVATPRPQKLLPPAPAATLPEMPAQRPARKTARKVLHADPIAALQRELDSHVPRLQGQEAGAGVKR